jgi:hypothetical protein
MEQGQVPSVKTARTKGGQNHTDIAPWSWPFIRVALLAMQRTLASEFLVWSDDTVFQMGRILYDGRG